MRLESDLTEALEASIEGRVSDGDFKWSQDASVCVVMSSGGYPGTYEVGKRIDGLEEAAAISGVKVFHAGTSKRDGVYYTAGGRVLGVTARAADLETAVARAYEACGKISLRWGALSEGHCGESVEEIVRFQVSGQSFMDWIAMARDLQANPRCGSHAASNSG